jgi:hypothetical protein
MPAVLDRIEMKCRLMKRYCAASPNYRFHRRKCRKCGAPFVAYYKRNQRVCHKCDSGGQGASSK